MAATILKSRNLKELLNDARLRYLLAGGFNTVFAYSLGLGLYTLLHGRWTLPLITSVASVISISMSFLTYKVFVFQTRGNWLREMIRCYMVYGGGALVGIVSLSILVDGWAMPFWIAQALVNVTMVLWSYFMHRRFTFRR